MKQKIFAIFVLLFSMAIYGFAQSYRAANWWNTPPERWQFFAGADVAFPESGMKNIAYGINVGYVKNFGFYGRAVFNGSPVEQEYKIYYYDLAEVLNSSYTTGNIKRSFQAFTAGAMLRLWCPLYLHIGAGYAKHQAAYELENGMYVINENEIKCLETGLSLRINNLMLHSNYMLDLHDGGKGAVTVGASYCF